MNEQEQPRPRRLRFSLRSLILLVALAGSGYGLRARWGPWVVTKLYEGRHPGYFYFVGLTPDERYLIGGSGDVLFAAWDLESGRELEPDELNQNADHFADCVNRPTANMCPRLKIRNGRVYVQPSTAEEITSVIHPPIDAISAVSTADCAGIFVAAMERIYYFKKHRPVNWWGVACLPEFWLTLALGVGLLWSVWGDRKGLKPTETATGTAGELDIPQDA